MRISVFVCLGTLVSIGTGTVAPGDDPPRYTTLRHEFMAEFAEFHRSHPFADPDSVATCSELWRDHSLSRKFLYRLDAHLESIRRYVPSDALIPSIDRDADASIEAFIDSPSWERLTDLSRGIERMRGFGDSNDEPHIEDMLLEQPNLHALQQALSIVRLSQDSNPEHVPLFYVDIATGAPGLLTFDRLSQLISGLRQVREVITGDVPLSDKRSFLANLMGEVEYTIRMISRAREHRSGEEFDDAEYQRRPNGEFPRVVRLSEDPLARIDEITEQVVASIDFCRGLLFRFVSRETRDEWMETSHELYNILEQLYIGDEVDPQVEYVRLAWLRDFDIFVTRIREMMRGGSDASIRILTEELFDSMASRHGVSLDRVYGLLEPSRIVFSMNALDHFTQAVYPLMNGQQYLTPSEADVFVGSARVLGYSLSMESNTREEPIWTTSMPLTASYSDEELPWTLIELLEVVTAMGRVSDLRSLLGDMAESSMSFANWDVILDGLFRSDTGSRLLIENTEIADIVKLKIIQRLMHSERGRVILEWFVQNPEKRENLVTFWESYDGENSTALLRVLLHGTGLKGDSVALSSLIQRVADTDAVGRLVDMARLFLEDDEDGIWPEFTDEARDGMMNFWARHDKGSGEVLLTFIAMNPIMFPDPTARFCDGLENAASVIDPLVGERWTPLARRILVSRCPQFSPLADRTALLRVRPTSYPYLEVSRDRLMTDALAWFEMHTGDEIRSGDFRVYFVDEDGVDGGGLRREWFFLLARKIAEGLFVEGEAGSGRLEPSAEVDENVMESVGKFVAKSVTTGQYIPIRFTKVIYRYILEGLDNVEVDLEMYTIDHPSHARSLSWILQNDPSSDAWIEAMKESRFALDILEAGTHRVHELMEDGANIRITEGNRVEYVQAVIEFKIRQSIRSQLESFLAGFYSVLPREKLEGRFTPDELETVIAGDAEIDITDLETNTHYTGYTATDQQIIWFWEIVHAFDQDQLRLLVKFSSGTPLAPVGGFASLPLIIARVGLNDHPADNPLPSSHTCYNQLDLPAYTSKAELGEKLVRSITIGSEGFGFA
jgi:hypothetical protein